MCTKKYSLKSILFQRNKNSLLNKSFVFEFGSTQHMDMNDYFNSLIFIALG